MFMKWQDKLYLKYMETFQSLDPKAKLQMKHGFQLVGLSLLLLGICAMSFFQVIGGLLTGFGIGMIIAAGGLFR